MSKPIKFRAWDKVDGGMHQNVQGAYDYTNMFADEMVPATCFQEMLNNYTRYEVMQYTGLTDRNGVEIYEGDIVRIANYETDWGNSKPDFDWRVFEVQWNRYLWAFNNSAIYAPMSDYNPRTTEPYDIEVIGNIHEHPHLLERSES